MNKINYEDFGVLRENTLNFYKPIPKELYDWFEISTHNVQIVVESKVYVAKPWLALHRIKDKWDDLDLFMMIDELEGEYLDVYCDLLKLAQNVARMHMRKYYGMNVNRHDQIDRLDSILYLADKVFDLHDRARQMWVDHYDAQDALEARRIEAENAKQAGLL